MMGQAGIGQVAATGYRECGFSVGGENILQWIGVMVAQFCVYQELDYTEHIYTLTHTRGLQNVLGKNRCKTAIYFRAKHSCTVD